ncbi:MAG: DUF445 family protein [Clostridia bacterium]|nr:DUF445 family protein [Clostridia bacterium]
MDIRLILTPFIGGVIGYITNDIAIKMLFHPRRAYYIKGKRIPFTPGLIPAQKNRIARSIARVISTQLLNDETMKNTLLSDTVIAAIRVRIERFIVSHKEDRRTLGELGEEYFGAEKFDELTEVLKNKAAKKVTGRIINADIGRIAVGYALESLRDKFGFLSMLLKGDMIDEIGNDVAEHINKVVEQKAPEVIDAEISKLGDEIKQKSVCGIIAKYEDKTDVAVDYIIEFYKRAVGDNIGRIMKTVDIEGTVYDRVAAFDAVELERMIFGIMKRELRAIVYLGAVLGFLMGFVNVLIFLF